MEERHHAAGAPWYKDAILYEVHVRAFADSNGDGIGDFRGLTSKLDYLQDLGVTTLWLLPFYPSPLKDDGYDIADYMTVHPSYGTVRDFKVFLREAHARGLKVVTELVINHTSDQHPWFQRARTAPPGSKYRDFYVWTDNPNKYSEARIIFTDTEHSNWSWDPIAKAYYWHRFYSHQPDLNYDNPAVMKAVLQVLDFWLNMGVDGLRLDAIPYLYEREGTNCENLPETHAALKQIRAHMDVKHEGRMLLAEANQWPEDAVAYFGDDDECNMSFHFPVMPRMFMALRMEDRFPIVDIMAQTPAIPENAQWALFLRNHDELTLEMVTDEERDYMYRVYASDREARINLGIRRRLAPLLNNNRRRIELMNGLLFSLPGTPVLYYGDEIGMGDNVYLGDRNGVRTPMQWSSDRNAGFSNASPQRLYFPVITEPEYNYETINVETQQRNPQSLLWWVKRLIALRKRYPAFGRGSLEFLYPENRKVLTFLRRDGDQTILVVANLSRFVQAVELNLGAYEGSVPVELFGHTEFPAIGQLPYFLTLGPHSFYWFALEPARVADIAAGVTDSPRELPVLAVADSWEEVFAGRNRTQFQTILREYIRERRWFGGKARRITTTEIVDHIPVPMQGGGSARFALVRVSFTEGDPDIYTLPLAYATGARAGEIGTAVPQVVIARVTRGIEPGILYDAMWEAGFTQALLDAVGGRRRFRGERGEVIGVPTTAFRTARGPAAETLAPNVGSTEQSNTSVTFGDRLIFKLFRRLGEGANPDLEIGRFLTERANFSHIPAVAGGLEYRSGRDEPVSLGIVQAYAPNEGDAWSYTLDVLGDYYEQVAAQGDGVRDNLPKAPNFRQMPEEFPPIVAELVGSYLESARLLGQRTGEMHRALASDARDPAFAPEPFTALYQRSTYQSLRSQANAALQLLHARIAKLPEGTQADARQVLDAEKEIFARFGALRDQKITAARTRVHGDYHLGQVLFTGKDFVIIDFEGEPARPLGERRIKRSPLRDVAGMLRSFHYAAYSLLFDPTASGAVRPEDFASLEPWARFWYDWVAAVFLRAYYDTACDTPFVPKSDREFDVLLDARLLEKALYELLYELNNRPTWADIPLRGILDLVERHGEGSGQRAAGGRQ